MTSFDDFPRGSILSEMRLDIYASKKRGDVNMFYEGEFYKTLERLEYDAAARVLFFIFAGGRRIPLGAPIDAALAPYIEKAAQIAAFQVTLEGQAGAAQMIDLIQI